MSFMDHTSAQHWTAIKNSTTRCFANLIELVEIDRQRNSSLFAKASQSMQAIHPRFGPGCRKAVLSDECKGKEVGGGKKAEEAVDIIWERLDGVM
jgi:hypothetical protein